MSAIFEKIDGHTVITKEDGKPFRILQLTDIHIGGGPFSLKKDKLALSAVEKIVKAADADFVVVTGDVCYPLFPWSGTFNNLRGSRKFANLMNKLGVEWTLVYGNHDTESFAFYDKAYLSKFYSRQPKCHFEVGEAGLTGMGNYCIRLNNPDGSLNTALMFLDSNAYLTKSFFSGFDVIHDDQIDWYKRTVNALGSDGRPARSLAFFHIPPKEFKEGWDKRYKGDPEVIYHHGFVQEKDNYFGYPKTKDGNFFKEMVTLGSCKGMFMGHDHLNTLSITYQGIRLTYGMSIDYLAYKGIRKKHTQRGGTIIEIFDDGSFEVSMLPLDDIIKE
ncbi:MAG: metallophosphoesterase [Bacteroides sp.]|nr:metallophosphoesterase [Bacillota bacterium]MCM1394149.1 metallophosphoesterase [[Eubacterium] siraeum]MCM1455631.1 metallophosphoesterase [Bacteroides sp.]